MGRKDRLLEWRRQRREGRMQAGQAGTVAVCSTQHTQRTYLCRVIGMGYARGGGTAGSGNPVRVLLCVIAHKTFSSSFYYIQCCPDIVLGTPLLSGHSTQTAKACSLIGTYQWQPSEAPPPHPPPAQAHCQMASEASEKAIPPKRCACPEAAEHERQQQQQQQPEKSTASTLSLVLTQRLFHLSFGGAAGMTRSCSCSLQQSDLDLGIIQDLDHICKCVSVCQCHTSNSTPPRVRISLAVSPLPGMSR